ncbi:hypothetical protein SAMN02800692_3593 [Luteibacter sp. UNC138MFCol5.1]|uniref:hypothetical protein n=1 Tax=Luteibacter sp. UNC138MFCol5.1 TaxID=1502774 RepID=UPI0008C06F5E|nr:hypothetical protein [Luteibacter sp. UNC138MFCol5.1]SEP09094.1 hypothetical protein SAMN02800692_3593 [Luteibacter sp. UNC138MFCol5.1]
MSLPGRSSTLRAVYPLDPEATTHDLLNGAVEWLGYARTLTEFLADLIHESDTVECGRMALSLEAIASLVQIGAHCTAQAHARMTWGRVQGD